MRFALPIIVAVGLAVYAVIDCLQTDPAQVRGPRRPVWIAVILLLPIVGPVAWLVARRGGLRFPSRRRRPASPPVAPDDNPEFLRQLRSIDEQHQRMLSEWEADLRRREEEQRKNGGDDGEDSPRT